MVRRTVNHAAAGRDVTFGAGEGGIGREPRAGFPEMLRVGEAEVRRAGGGGRPVHRLLAPTHHDSWRRSPARGRSNVASRRSPRGTRAFREHLPVLFVIEAARRLPERDAAEAPSQDHEARGEDDPGRGSSPSLSSDTRRQAADRRSTRRATRATARSRVWDQSMLEASGRWRFSS